MRIIGFSVLQRTIILAALSVLLTGWGSSTPEWPHSGPMPDEPVEVPSSGYRSIGAGFKSYRPVEPLPWGDTNRRVAPPDTAPVEPQQQQPQPAPTTPPAMAPMPGMQH